MVKTQTRCGHETDKMIRQERHTKRERHVRHRLADKRQTRKTWTGDRQDIDKTSDTQKTGKRQGENLWQTR
jgi:hypothetical protein